MVVDSALNLPRLKRKRSFEADYFGLEPDKAVPKTVPKVVLWKSIPLYLLGLLVIIGRFWCPGEDVELSVFIFYYNDLFLI